MFTHMWMWIMWITWRISGFWLKMWILRCGKEIHNWIVDNVDNVDKLPIEHTFCAYCLTG